MTASCFKKLRKQFETNKGNDIKVLNENPVITELAVISVKPGKNNKPDMFTALIKGYYRKAGDERLEDDDHSDKFSAEWSFVRQGLWWMLDAFKSA